MCRTQQALAVYDYSCHACIDSYLYGEVWTQNKFHIKDCHLKLECKKVFFRTQFHNITIHIVFN